jgi:hypothetical protein
VPRYNTHDNTHNKVVWQDLIGIMGREELLQSQSHSENENENENENERREGG